jgi:hypothetical protein
VPPKKTILRSEVTLDAEQLRAIGCVVVESAYLEETLDFTIQHLAVIDEHDMRALTGSAQMAARLSVLKGLMDSRLEDKFKDECALLCRNIMDRITERNNVVHGIWHVQTLRSVGHAKPERPIQWVREGEPFVTRNKRGEAGHTVIKPRDIMAIAYGLAQAALDLHRFLNKTGLFPPRYERKLRRNPMVVQIRDSPSTTTKPDKGRSKDQE